MHPYRRTSLLLFLSAAFTISAHSQTIEPQIVRLSLVQGDVRIARGALAAKENHTTWEKAVANLPLETGFSLVTGDGRAEIEFEDASTLYLAPNSVLTFDNLSTIHNPSTSHDIPHTELELISGTITTNLQPRISGEWYIIRTATDHFSVGYPSSSLLRVTSYLDAMTVTPLRDLHAEVTNTPNQSVFSEHLEKDRTATFSNGEFVGFTAIEPAAKFADWDTWVTNRITARDTLMATAMHEAGLTTPEPGLADMAANGTFSDCAPYGRCWTPTNGWTKPARLPVPSSTNPSPYVVSTTQLARQNIHPNPQTQAQSNPAQPPTWEEFDDFPCLPQRTAYLYSRDPLTGKPRLIGQRTLWDPFPYTWAACHTGNWIHRERRYVWVAGRKHHHHPPVHWVSYGKEKAFVPAHPHDVAGKPPVNLKYGLFATTGKHDTGLERLEYNASVSVKPLAEAPKEFLEPTFQHLSPADPPHLNAYSVKQVFAAAHAPDNKPSGTPISFDHKAQTFTIASHAADGTRILNVPRTYGGAGTLEAQRSGNPAAYQAARSNSSYSGVSSTRASSSSGSYASSSGAAATHTSSTPAASSAPAASFSAAPSAAPSSSGAAAHH